MLKKEKQKEVWVRFKNRAAYLGKEVKFLESLREYPGEYQVIVYLEQEKAKRKLHQMIDDAGITELKERFGIDNVQETERETELYKPAEPVRDSIERIADALESISSTLDSIDQSLDLISDVLGDCRIKNRNGSAIAITGVIDHV